MPRQPLSMWTALAFAPLVLSQAALGDIAGQYHCDEAPGATVADDAIGSANATLNGAAAFVSGGIVGNALQLSRTGNGFAVAGPDFRFTGDYSVVCWVKTAPGFTGENFVIGNHVTNTNNGYITLMNVNLPSCYGALNKAAFYQAGGCNSDARSTTNVNDGQWHQVVGVHRAGGRHRIYVDGAPAEHILASSGTPYAAGARFMLGGLVVGSTPTGFYTGLIDEVQLYPHLLTDAQIDFLFQNPAQTVIGALGDLNCDGFVTVSDIGAFVLAQTNPAGYAAAFPACNIMHADLNMDGVVSVSDIAPFVTVLTD